MNPTEKFISKLDSLLTLIPARFIKSNITPDFKTATIEISIPDSQDLIKIQTKQGLITIDYRNNLKKFNCHFLNSAGQIDDAFNYISFLAPKDSDPKPNLLVNQLAMAFCEPDTGIILCSETMKRRIGWGNIYVPFESMENAIDFAENALKDKNVECILYNNKYEYLRTIPGQKSTNR